MLPGVKRANTKIKDYSLVKLLINCTGRDKKISLILEISQNIS